MNLALISSVKVLYFLHLFVKSDASRNWDLELLSFEVESSDENLANVSARLVHHEIGRESISGFIDWKFDTDDETRTKMKVQWSRTGREKDYNELPYHIPNITFYEGVNHYYMKLLYPEVASCSNMPAIEKFVPPWKRGTYIFNECEPTGVTAPQILPRGYYKIVYKIIGKAELVFIVTVKVKPRFMM